MAACWRQGGGAGCHSGPPCHCGCVQGARTRSTARVLDQQGPTGSQPSQVGHKCPPVGETGPCAACELHRWLLPVKPEGSPCQCRRLTVGSPPGSRHPGVDTSRAGQHQNPAPAQLARTLTPRHCGASATPPSASISSLQTAPGPCLCLTCCTALGAPGCMPAGDAQD